MELLSYLWSNYFIYIVDILCVAYVLYRIMLLIKGTRAVQIILGIIILIFITFVARGRLITLYWLLEKFWYAGVIILAVTFQPEIRSALAQLGSHSWGRILVPAELGFVDEIIEAVQTCVKQRIGALIVLEQDTGLRSYVETGVILNAVVSKELILSIFNPSSPLHDGAVIIQNDRILSAKCVLPLSNEPSLFKIFGTRHRSAVGLSEISDAIIIVVSEETSYISVAKAGRLETNVDLAEIRRRLLGLYREKAENSFLRKIIKK